MLDMNACFGLVWFGLGWVKVEVKVEEEVEVACTLRFGSRVGGPTVRRTDGPTGAHRSRVPAPKFASPSLNPRETNAAVLPSLLTSTSTSAHKQTERPRVRIRNHGWVVL